jgi:5-methyltetrahydrofolate--homocysteine methyltransferase
VTDNHIKYYEAGSDVVHTNTFGGNTIKLAERGLADKMETINVAAARLAREGCPAGKFVAGDIGPTGKLLKPLGDLVLEEAEEGFFRQAQALLKGGVDLISIETMFSLEEALAALRAAKRLGDVLVIAALTFNRTKKGFFTMMGEGVKQAVSAFEGAGADVIASNCSLGSRDMIDLTKELRAATRKPILIQPTFVTHLPKELVPLAKLAPEDPTRCLKHDCCVFPFHKSCVGTLCPAIFVLGKIRIHRYITTPERITVVMAMNEPIAATESAGPALP